MRVIDLLNKIAKGEEVPKKIKWDEEEFIYGKNRIYRNEDDEPLVYNLLPSGENLNDEIKIIEEVEDIGYEDIEEIAYKPRKVQNAINALIRNQNKIIERMKRDE